MRETGTCTVESDHSSAKSTYHRSCERECTLRMLAGQRDQIHVTAFGRWGGLRVIEMLTLEARAA
jgi:hypothetical protein